MNYMKRTYINGNAVPRSAMKPCGFSDYDRLCLRALPGAAVVLKRDMTAKDLLDALDSITQASADLLDTLRGICGSCDTCDGSDCPLPPPGAAASELPDTLREAAGIPRGAALRVDVDREHKSVTFSADSAATLDIPERTRVLLDASMVCEAALRRHLDAGDVICRV